MWLSFIVRGIALHGDNDFTRLVDATLLQITPVPVPRLTYIQTVQCEVTGPVGGMSTRGHPPMILSILSLNITEAKDVFSGSSAGKRADDNVL